jgi:hypothetical protein
MARLNTTEIVVKVSKLQRDNEEDDLILGTETIVQLQAIITELVGVDVVVEIEEK